MGSRYKLTEQRISEQRERILRDCHVEKLSCSVLDALNEFSTDLQGMWTVIPAILRLPIISDWTIIAEETSEIDVKNLKFLEISPNETIFHGFGLVDKEPTIIHHFGVHAPPDFKYPLLSAGFVLSRDVIEQIRKIDQNERPNGFAIDAYYEFALLMFRLFGLRISHFPELFCIQKSSKCLVSRTTKQQLSSIDDNDIQVMIKTFSGYHQTRLPMVMNTWTRGISRIEYCSDLTDSTIPTIDLGVENTERGHCGKTWAIFTRFLSVKSAKWLLIADDDTLMSWSRLKKMLVEFDPQDRLIIGERYGFGFGFNGESGYDYPTGGSGMIFTRPAVESLLETCPSCASSNDPDDMTIGMCAIQSGIPVVHEERLHQARFHDYATDYIYLPISFHKFTDIDPLIIYHYHLVDNDDLKKSEL